MDDTEDPMLCRTCAMNRKNPGVVAPVGGVASVTPEVFIRHVVADAH
jgi:hypothetical protein